MKTKTKLEKVESSTARVQPRDFEDEERYQEVLSILLAWDYADVDALSEKLRAVKGNHLESKPVDWSDTHNPYVEFCQMVNDIAVRLREYQRLKSE